ncbi:MAG: hypothetical protein ACQESC_04405 [Nanobdellota archaeon]
MKHIWLVMIVIVLAVSITACDSNIEQNTLPVDETSDEQDDTTTQEVTNTQQTEANTTAETYNNFKRELDNNQEYEVEYQLTHSSGKEETVNIYAKEDKTRVDVTSGETFSLWMTDVAVIESNGQCLELDNAKNFGFDPESIYKQVTVEGSIKTEDKYQEISSTGTKTMAGKTTNCYEFIYKTSISNQKTTFCLTEKGIPALIKTIDRDTGDLISEAKAQSIGDSVNEDVLEPCEPNMDVSGLI